MEKRASKKKENEGNKTKGDWSGWVSFHYCCLLLNRALTDCSLVRAFRAIFCATETKVVFLLTLSKAFIF